MKKAIKDFDKTKLPNNRFQVFFDILKNRSNVLINLGLVILVCSIPFIVVNVLYNLLSTNISKMSLSTDEMYGQLLTILNLKNLLYIPCLIILAFGLSGCYQIIRRLVFYENMLFKSEFIKGIKSNYWHFFFTLTVIGLFNFLIQTVLFMKTNMNSTYYKLALCILIVMIILFIPIAIIIFSHTTLYNLPFIYRIKNGLLISILKFYYMIPLGILNLGLILITLIKVDIVYIFSLVFLPLISPFIIMLNTLVCNNVFDKYINKENYKEIYKKGIANNE